MSKNPTGDCRATTAACSKQVKAQRIRDLNDAFRRTGIGGRIMLTASVMALSDPQKVKLLLAVSTFSDFNADNDPYGEHDFGAIDQDGERFFWKLDYYDLTLTAGSEDPSDPARTTRVLTIMLASEY